ncbi:class I SAM-dependent methyltransferase [candidate division KSB1 bacterium]|nr:class I SAM-dependent methyltransferase [candidate division KSB1 bacterium]
MTENPERSISDSLEVDQKLLPYMPFLLQDLWALGSSVDDILSAIRSLELPADQTRILDLGCGKGAVSVRIASQFGYNVVGIDAMEPFLVVAREKAADYKVSHRCQFINQDIVDYVLQEHEFDVVILAAVGALFGSITDTIAKLRTQVKSGGYILIDDGYLKNMDRLDRKGYEYCRNYDETIKELTAHGDRIIKEINTTEFSIRINAEYQKTIEKRGQELIKGHHELERDINDYIRLQAEECHIIDTLIEGMLWIVQKNR